MKLNAWKKVFSVFLAVVMVMLSIPMTAVAEDALTEGNFTYTVTDGKATITDFPKDFAGDVIIPDTLGGYPVVCIGADAFYDCTGITSVTIPDGVTSIGSYAFYNCTRLANVKIPDGVTSIGDYAFGGCWCLWSVIIPDGVTCINNGTFSACTYLSSVTIPESVTSIGDEAFYWCHFESITIPAGVTSIGNDAFLSCAKLKSVCYGGNEVQWQEISIGSGNSTLENINIYYAYPPESYFKYTVTDGETTITAFSDNNYRGQVVIPDVLGGYPVVAIEDYTFCEFRLITSVVIPISITRISPNVFSCCSSLTDIYYAGSQSRWQEISGGNFSSALTNVTIHCGEANPALSGDVNGNGVVDISDLATFRRFIGGATIAGFNETAADMDGDGFVKVSDVSTLARIIAGAVI